MDQQEAETRTTRVRLWIDIDESTALDEHIPSSLPSVEIDCEGVKRINSSGVRLWIDYFSRLRADGTRLSFRNCAPPLVEQWSMIPNFLVKSEVKSVLVPFRCSACAKAFNQPYTLDELGSLDVDRLQMPCLACSQPAEFEDIPDEYFVFLKRP